MNEQPQLSINNIVLVIANDKIHHGMQGQVVGFDETDEEAPVRVWFGKEADYHIDYLQRERMEKLTKQFAVEPPSLSEQAQDPRTWNYGRNDLTICSTWSMKTLVKRHFKNMYHFYYEPKALFMAGVQDCDIESCANLATQRIIFNIWGSVMFADVCAICAPKYHLLCGDSFPWKKRKIAKTA